MSEEKFEIINPDIPIIKKVRCKILYQYTGNILEYKKIYNVIKEKKDAEGNVCSYKLMDLDGNILKSYYFKWRFYDTDLISDIPAIKDRKEAIAPNMNLTFYLYSLNDSMAAFSLNYKTEVLSYFLKGGEEFMLTPDTYVEILNIPAITETITFLSIEEMKNRINFLISNGIIVKHNDRIRLTDSAINSLNAIISNTIENSPVINNDFLREEILLNNLYKLQASCFKPFIEPMNLLRGIISNKNYFLATHKIPAFVFIFFKKINDYTTKADTIINFNNTLHDYIYNTFSFYYKKDNTFINNQTIVSLNKEIHNFTYGKPYLVLNSKKIRNSLEIIKLETDNDNVYKYIDKRYLKIMEDENTPSLFMFHKFTKTLCNAESLTYIDQCAYRLCIIFLFKFTRDKDVCINKDKDVIKKLIVEKIITCLGNKQLYNVRSWFPSVPNILEDANISFNNGIFEIDSKKLQLELKTEINFMF
jgi:hypothetical protein